MTTEKKMLTIAMSERRPLRIDKEEWPIIAEADWWNGEHESQANYVRRIKVREHDDGRRIVYGFYGAGQGGAPIGFRGSAGGFLIDWPVPVQQRDPQVRESFEAETIRAIRRVGGIISDDGLASACIADMPEESI